MRKTFRIPDPPDVDVVENDDHISFYRCDPKGEYWVSTDPRARGTYAWHELLFQRGPVREA